MLVPLILRSVQLIFSAVVLGLSITLIQSQWIGSAPATTSYGAFAGAFGMLAAAIGITAVSINTLSGVIIWAIDALASVFFLAGGAAIAVALKGVSCSDSRKASTVPMLNGGCVKGKGQEACGYGYQKAEDLKRRCQMAEADSAFMFMTLLVCVGTIGVSWFLARRSGGNARRKGAHF